MSPQLDFRALAERAARESQLLPVVEKELLHYEILTALATNGYLRDLTFQGGTALRLCYGSDRYSEDLDFTGGTSFDEACLVSMGDAIRDSIRSRYAVDVVVKNPKPGDANAGVSVRTWQVQVITAPGRSDIPQQRIKLEIAAVPSHTRAIRAIQVNYTEVAATHADTLLAVETLDEITADKAVSVCAAKVLRYRDLWDLRWLSTQGRRDHALVAELVAKKVADYGISEYPAKVAAFVDRLPSVVESAQFLDQMRRFVPRQVLARTLDRSEFREHLAATVSELLISAVSLV